MKTDLEREYELLRETEAAAAELFLRAISASYQKPEAAIGRIATYRFRKGQDALLKKLAIKPAFFGRSKCHALPASSGRAGSLRKDAKIAMVLLPIFAREMLDARARRADFEIQLSGAPARFNEGSLSHTNLGESQVRSF